MCITEAHIKAGRFFFGKKADYGRRGILFNGPAVRFKDKDEAVRNAKQITTPIIQNLWAKMKNHIEKDTTTNNNNASHTVTWYE